MYNLNAVDTMICACRMQSRLQKEHRLIKEKVEKPVTMKTEQARGGLMGCLMLLLLLLSSSSSSSLP